MGIQHGLVGRHWRPRLSRSSVHLGGERVALLDEHACGVEVEALVLQPADQLDAFDVRSS